MPLRFTLTSAVLTAQLPAPTAAWSCHRFFHASPRTLRLETNTSSSANHYETLNVHPTASAAEIKKSFYHLSKRHHPDHNPSDPHAPTRFMRISEAYAVLSHADKRARYDRHHGHHHQRPAGASYHSTGPAGGRPASGLSRRRGTYQGPPPSFYRSGGWGAHGAKRRAAHEESTGGAGSGSGSGFGFGTDARPHQDREWDRYAGAGSGAGAGAGAGPGTAGGSGVGAGPPPPPPGGSGGGMGSGRGGFGFGYGYGGAGGMGPGQDPYGHRDDVPHFDHEAHERTQRRGDERRAHRRAREKGVNIDQPETGTTVSFLGAVAILAVVVMGPFLLTGGRRDRATAGGSGNASSKAGEKEKAKGNNNNKNNGKESGGR